MMVRRMSVQAGDDRSRGFSGRVNVLSYSLQHKLEMPRMTMECWPTPAASARYSSFSHTGKHGGEGGIRTHGTLAGTPDFESGTIDHSATSPVRKGET